MVERSRPITSGLQAFVLLLFGLLLAQLPLFAPSAMAAPAREGAALVLTMDDAIGPASLDYLRRGLARAEADGDRVLVIELDTPGGLVSSMREMIKSILASPVPVVTYVAPPGARAASAGTYLMYASHIAAMAPATHLGSATPVRIGLIPGLSDRSKPTSGQGASGSTMEHKITEDAVAFIRSLAERRGRNADWAEEAVRQAANLDARQALKQNVIDVVAPDLGSLLKQIDGRRVMMAHSPLTLHTAHLKAVSFDPGWRSELLSIIADPTVAYLLLLAGFIGIVIELFNPGSTVPGVTGAICLLLALFAFQVLSVNFAGLALILLGLGFIVTEAFLPTFGILGVGGVVSFVVGSIMLMDGLHRQVSIPLIGGIALIAGAFLLWMATRFLKLRRRTPVTGDSRMIGLPAKVLTEFEPAAEQGRWTGRVLVQGENWQAFGNTLAHRGEIFRVTAVQGLRLEVAPFDSGPTGIKPRQTEDRSTNRGDSS